MKYEWKDNTEIKLRWSSFINEAYINFRGDTRKTIAQFAEAIGVSRPLLSQWMSKNTKIPTSQENINKLYLYFGPIIYDVLGLARPDENFGLENFPPRLREAALEIRETLSQYNVSGDSDEAELLAIEILKKHGYRITTPTEESPSS